MYVHITSQFTSVGFAQAHPKELLVSVVVTLKDAVIMNMLKQLHASM